jgi:hypothetical protein
MRAEPPAPSTRPQERRVRNGCRPGAGAPWRRWTSLGRRLAAATALCAIGAAGTHAQAAGAAADAGDAALEYRVKAAYLYQFGKFVEWPAAAFPSPTATLTLCVVGDDPFGPVLDDTVRSKTIAGHAISVVRVSARADLHACHILFLSADQSSALAQIVERTAGSPVLIVGEAPDFARRGGAVNFVLQQNRVLFEVNPRAAARGGLRISSKLLSLARIVADGDVK